MSKCIVYTRSDDGGLSIVYPEAKDILVAVLVRLGKAELADRVASYSEDEYIEWIRDKDVPPDALNVSIIDAGNIPNELTVDYVLENGAPVRRVVDHRSYRQCWRLVGDRVIVDPQLETQERWRRIRRVRNALLQASDGPMVRQIEISGPKHESGASYRQMLRDIPTQADPKNLTWPLNVFDSK